MPEMMNDIGRRDCSRVVPMEVLCLGRERTGTASIRAALRQLGYHDIYHMTSVLDENPRDSDMWCEAFDAKFYGKGTFGQKEWDQLLGHCMGTCDEPGAYFAEELMAAYPSAKIILTVRDSPEVWLRSVIPSTYRWAVDLMKPSWNPLIALRRVCLRRPPFLAMLERLYVVNGYFSSNFPESGTKRYVEHNERLRKLAAERAKSSSKGLGANGDAFLEFNAKDGWQPLCEFLGKTCPNTPYPHVNNGEDFTRFGELRRRAENKVIVATVAKLLGSVGVAVAGIWLATRTL